jgi:hypothetical protein
VTNYEFWLITFLFDSSRNASKLCFRLKVQDALTSLGHDNEEMLLIQLCQDTIDKWWICVSSTAAAAADLSEELFNDDPVSCGWSWRG